MELNMGKGKIAAQCGHATLGAFRLSQKHCSSALTWWHRTGQAKIAVKVEKESELSVIENKAREAGLITYQVCQRNNCSMLVN
jgi:PTH2 family peptidyl-tRNA hydrolase